VIEELKALAPKNISFISITFEVSHCEMSELKDVACWNMLFIIVTFEVSQFEIEELKMSAA